MAENISRTIVAAGTDTSEIARAADMDSADLNALLNSEVDMTVGELIRVGGALRVSPGSLLEGAAA